MLVVTRSDDKLIGGTMDGNLVNPATTNSGVVV